MQLAGRNETRLVSRNRAFFRLVKIDEATDEWIAGEKIISEHEESVPAR